jgi:2-oxoglutarate dehydrogenase E1 component
VELIEALARLPEGFRPHPTIARGLARRRETAAGTRPVDWSTAEALAFATLATEGHRVRLSGQDTARGTFSHRHAVLHDAADGRTYMPLGHVAPDQAPVEVYNSPLSEVGVLGFEYGYSLDCPGGLVLWEAQFGDFWDAASDRGPVHGERRGEVAPPEREYALLPHGFGPGPGIERPARALPRARRQRQHPDRQSDHSRPVLSTLRPGRSPVAEAPGHHDAEGLLRHAKVVSSLTDLEGSFQRILPDAAMAPKQVRRVITCSGKVYYDLPRRAEKIRTDNVASSARAASPVAGRTLGGPGALSAGSAGSVGGAVNTRRVKLPARALR